MSAAVVESGYVRERRLVLTVARGWGGNMDNYAVINGKHIELTDEQVKALGIETKTNPFNRMGLGYEYEESVYIGKIVGDTPLDAQVWKCSSCCKFYRTVEQRYIYIYKMI